MGVERDATNGDRMTDKPTTPLQDAFARWDSDRSEHVINRIRSDSDDVSLFVEAARRVANAEQIGWFDPASKRFCYSDEKEVWPDTRQGYTVPVFTLGITKDPNG